MAVKLEAGSLKSWQLSALVAVISILHSVFSTLNSHHSMDFRDKLVVITGVGRAGQAGEVIARTFAERGATLALMDLQQAEVEARAATLVSAGFNATAHVANLSDAVAATAAAAEVVAKHAQFRGAVHAVICAAGGFGMTGPVDASDPAAWHKQFMINLDTAYATTRAFQIGRASCRERVCYAV